MKIKKSELRLIIKEEIKRLNEEEDFVVSGLTGGYNQNSERWDYIVSAKNKNDAKKKVKQKKSNLKKLSVKAVSEYSTLDPYVVFERL